VGWHCHRGSLRREGARLQAQQRSVCGWFNQSAGVTQRQAVRAPHSGCWERFVSDCDKTGVQAKGERGELAMAQRRRLGLGFSSTLQPLCFALQLNDVRLA